MAARAKFLTKVDSAINFCLDCGNLIDLPQYLNEISCGSCSFKCSILGINLFSCADYPYQEIVTKKVFTEKKKWLEDLDKVGAEGEQAHTEKRDSRTIIQEACPNPKGCDSSQLFFYTRQLRGADEGATVFYECVKCG